MKQVFLSSLFFHYTKFKVQCGPFWDFLVSCLLILLLMLEVLFLIFPIFWDWEAKVLVNLEWNVEHFSTFVARFSLQLAVISKIREIVACQSKAWE